MNPQAYYLPPKDSRDLVSTAVGSERWETGITDLVVFFLDDDKIL
jgi:hypothetical protein